MKKIIMLLVVIVTLATVTAKAQSLSSEYRTALGVKVWNDGGGVSLKHFVGNNNALEGIGYFWNGGSRITGLYEFHFDIEGAQGLKWYVGPGAHIGFYNSHYYETHYYNGRTSGSFIGFDGVLGLDYKFNGVPINLSLDWQPSFEFGDNRGFIGSWGGLGIRYTFN
jgi:hypothetical protein